MTYCLGVLVAEGVVLASDSRTNAGVDNVSTFSKMRHFAQDDRWIGAVCSGHLGITQLVFEQMEEMALYEQQPNWRTVRSMREAADLFGRALARVREQHTNLVGMGIDTSANFIIAGQIGAERPRMFLIYAQGNYIESQDGTLFFQIGETKYGKPMLDRVIQPEQSLLDVSKCALISFDATMRSNLSVGLPIDLALYKANSLQMPDRWRFTESDAYWQSMREHWQMSLRSAFSALPVPPMGQSGLFAGSC